MYSWADWSAMGSPSHPSKKGGLGTDNNKIDDKHIVCV